MIGADSSPPGGTSALVRLNGIALAYKGRKPPRRSVGLRIMGRAACAFNEADATRLFRAAKEAGVRIRLEIEPGKMTATMIGDGATARIEDELDRELADFEAQHAG